MQVNDLLHSWGTWARKGHDNLGYPSISTIAKFSKVQVLLTALTKAMMLVAIVDNAVNALSKMHPSEGEIIKMTYVHRMPVADGKSFRYWARTGSGKVSLRMAGSRVF